MRSLARTVVTSMMGNLFEWYDFALFGYFAAIIGKLFFPTENEFIQTIAAFGVFAVGFIARPIGGIFFGYIGDKFGRKKALLATILLMAFPTTLIGLLPTYSNIGVFAPIMLIILRLLQGISMGGNYGGSITFTSEHAQKHHRGLIASFAITSCLVGIMLGSGTAAVFNVFLSEESMYSFGWRIPFLLGILICLVGWYLRLNVHESPEYIASKKSGDIVINPTKTLFKKHKKSLAIAVFTVMLHDLSFYMLFIYMATYLTQIIHLSDGEALTINTISLVLVSFMTIFGAWLSDRIGRIKVLLVSAVSFVLVTYPLLALINNYPTPKVVLIAQLLLAIPVGCFFGPTPAFLVEIFPITIRYSAVSIATNISGPLFGGTAPMVIASLIQWTGNSMIPAYYLTIAAIITSLVLCKLQRSKKMMVDNENTWY